MREFFKGWRRKVACAALVMALLSAAAWMRSRVIEDYFEFAIWNMVSQQGSVSIKVAAFYFQLPYWESHDLAPDGTGISNHYRFEVPYLSLVGLLTLLSAYLILWKPRPKEPQNA